MTDSNVLELAKLGDPQAIASLMNQSLESKGMLAKVERQGDCLEVVLEADRVPNRQALTAFVQKGISNLGTQSIRLVRILGQQVGASYPAWMQELQLGAEAPLHIQPETDLQSTTIQSLEATHVQSLEDTQIQDIQAPDPGSESFSGSTSSSPTISQPLELDDLWADEANLTEQSPDFLQDLLASNAFPNSTETVEPIAEPVAESVPLPDPLPEPVLEPVDPAELEDLATALDPATDASILSFLDELSGEPAAADFPIEATQDQSIYLDDLAADLAPDLAAEQAPLTADDLRDLMAAPDTIEPLPTELWIDPPVSEPEADLLNFLDQPPVQSEAETAESPWFELQNPNDFSAVAADGTDDFPDATLISQIPSLDLSEEFVVPDLFESFASSADSPVPEPDFNAEISNQQIEDLFATEPNITESFIEEPWLEDLPEDLPGLPYEQPETQVDLQQSLVSQVPSHVPSMTNSWLDEQLDTEITHPAELENFGLAAEEEAEIALPDFLSEPDPLDTETPALEIPALETPIEERLPEIPEPEIPELDYSLPDDSLDFFSDQMLTEQPNLLFGALPSSDVSLDPTPEPPDPAISFSPEMPEPPETGFESPAESVLPEPEPSANLRDWAEFSDDTALQPSPDSAPVDLDDDDFEELPPDFLQDWEDDPPEFSNFVDAPADPSFFAEPHSSLNLPDTREPASPSSLEAELDLLDLDAPELESPGLDALELTHPALPQLDLTEAEELELDSSFPDPDLAELLSEPPTTRSRSLPSDSTESGMTSSTRWTDGNQVNQANPVADINLSQDNLEQGLGDFREGFVEPLPDDFFEPETNASDWQTDLRQTNLQDEPLDLTLDPEADQILPPPIDAPDIIEPNIIAGPPLDPPDRPIVTDQVLATPSAETSTSRQSSREPSLIWVLLPLCAFIGGLLGFVLFKNRISAPPNPPPATETSPAAPASSLPASPNSVNPADPNALQVALERADSAVELGKTAQSVDDWKLVASRWQQSIELLQVIPASSPSYGAAQKKLTEYQAYLAVAQSRASQPITATAPLGAATIQASPSLATSPTASPAVSPAIPITCPSIASTANSQPVELSSIQFDPSLNPQAGPIIGCITNHTNQPITTVDVVYNSDTTGEATGKLTFSPLAPQQTVPFKSEFTVVPDVKQLTIASLNWTASDSAEVKQLPVTINVNRPAGQ